jgi:hypothetical protein
MIRFDILTQKLYESDLIRLEIENQSKRYQLTPKLICGAIRTLVIRFQIWANSDFQTDRRLFELFFFLFSFFYATDIFWAVTEWNNNVLFYFFICHKFKEKKKLDTKEFCENNKKRKFQKDITWLMSQALIPNDTNLVITWWCNPHATTPIPEKPTKSGLIGVWHKDNLYLGTNSIGNREPPSNKYWFANEKYKDDATKPVVLW